MKFGEGSYPKLNKFVDFIRAFQEKDMDVLCCVSGFKGFGKSTFILQVIKRYLERYMGIKMTPKNIRNYMAFDNHDVYKKIMSLPEYAPLGCDEAVRFALGEDWMKAESKELKKTFTQIRTKHHAIFFAIPNFWWLDKKYREDMTTIWVHIIKRGYAVVFTPDLAMGVDDVWHQKDFKKIFKDRSYSFFSTDTESLLKYVRKHRCYFDEFTFPQLDQRLYNKYVKIRDEHVYVEPEKGLGNRLYKWSIALRTIAWRLKNNGEKITYKEMMKRYYINPLTGEPVFDERTIALHVQEMDRLLREQKRIEVRKNVASNIIPK